MNEYFETANFCYAVVQDYTSVHQDMPFHLPRLNLREKYALLNWERPRNLWEIHQNLTVEAKIWEQSPLL